MTDEITLPDHLQRLWFIETTSGVQDIGIDLLIEGVHQPDEIQQALSAAVEQHDAFRMRFRLGRRGPVCEVVERADMVWETLNVHGGAAAVRSEALRQRSAEVHAALLDIEKGPVVAATLFRCSPKASVLALTVPQIVADAQTLRILVEDMLEWWRRGRGEAPQGQKAVPSYFASLSTAIAPRLGMPAPLFAQPRTPGKEPPVPRDGDCPGRLGSEGDEQFFFLGSQLRERLRETCERAGTTLFAGILTGFTLVVAEHGFNPQEDMGVVVSHRDRRRHARMAGCFVSLAPLRVRPEPGSDPAQLLVRTGRRLTEMRHEAAAKGVGPTLHHCSVMVSKVRDSKAELRGPREIRVNYRRRRRVQAECDIHLFVHDMGDDVELVLNHAVGVWTAEAVRTCGARMLEVLGELASVDMFPSCDHLAAPSPMVSALDRTDLDLDHVGLAVWEIDIGLRRLETQGVGGGPGRRVDDEGAGVALAMTGPVCGVGLELVAPLREDAPCVGRLTRDGEGSYHCCWRGDRLEPILGELARRGVEHTVIDTRRSSPMFPGDCVSFLLVEGFGLVEWLSQEGESSPACPPAGAGGLCILIRSTNVPNAARFLDTLGYRAEQGPEAQVREFFPPSGAHRFRLHVASNDGDGIVWISNRAQELGAREEPQTRAQEAPPMVTEWWDRVRLMG